MIFTVTSYTLWYTIIYSGLVLEGNNENIALNGNFLPGEDDEERKMEEVD